MATKTIKVPNASVTSFTTGENFYITGKNGFKSSVGTIPVLCTAKTLVGSDIYLTVKGLSYLRDLNHEEHILAVNDGQVNFSIAGQETAPTTLSFNPSMTTMYVAGSAADTIYQYSLDVAGDVSTARIKTNPFALGISTPTAVVFSSKGYIFYVVAGSTLYQYRNIFPWDTSTARLEKSASIVSSCIGIAFDSTGTKMYASTSSTVTYYSLSTPWDISSLTSVSSKTFTAMSLSITATDITFSSDGTKLYGLTASAIYQYTLTTAWDLSTATYASKTVSISAQELSATGLHVNFDGTKLYVIGTSGDDINEYNLTTPGDISTATFSSISSAFTSSPSGIVVSSDGTRAFIVDSSLNDIRRYNLRTPWRATGAYYANANINVTAMTGGAVSGELAVSSIFIPEDGSNVYVVGTTLGRVHQFSLNTAFDFSDIVSSRSFLLTSQDSSPQSIYIGNYGSRLFMLGATNRAVYQYSLSRLWNVETASLTTSYSLGATETTLRDLTFKIDGTKFYTLGHTLDSVIPYNMATPWSVSSVTSDVTNSGSLLATGDTTHSGMYFTQDGSSVYTIGDTTDKVYQFTLPAPWNPKNLRYGIASFSGLRGIDYVSIPISKKTGATASIGQIGYKDVIEELSVEITNYDLTKDNVVIQNQSGLNDRLLNVPFLIKLPQSVDYRYFKEKSLYVEGSRKTIVKTYDISGKTSYTANLGVIPLGSTYVELREDGELTSGWTWDQSYNFTRNDIVEKTQLRAVIDYYSVPAIEKGDTVTIQDTAEYKVSNVSYLSSDPQYNALLTANSVYRINLDRPISSIVTSGSLLINISPDLSGNVFSVNGAANTVVIDYDETVYPGNFDLAKSRIYSISTGSSNFNRAALDTDRRIKNLDPGYYILKARGRSSYGRVSSYVTKEINLKELYIGKITDLDLTEDIFIDTGQAASTRIIVSFTPIDSQNPIDYEIAYKLNGVADLNTFNTVKVAKSGIGSDGKIRYVINNVDRGPISNQQTITVRVTPLNGDTRGIASESTIPIQGKIDKPQNIQEFTARQFQDSIFFSYKVPTRGDNITPIDLDLNCIEIRKMVGACTAPTNSDWIASSAQRVLIAPTPSKGAQSAVDSFGIYTFLAKTVDTSGNEADVVTSTILNIIQPTDIAFAATYSESDPSANAVATGITNSNYTEYYFPSFSNSTNGGFSVPGGGSASNANGTSFGFTQGSDIFNDTLYTTGAIANYQTKVRTLSSIVNGSIKPSYQLDSEFSTSYNGLKETIWSSTTISSADSTVLRATGIGSYLSDATWTSVNRTLSNAGSSGNVFAIWNTNTSLGNSNSYALIAAVINTNAVKLGESYFANGVATGGNTLPNLTTAYTGAFSLVNLLQYSDESTTTFEGNPTAISDRVYVRYSDDASIFHANGNVIIENFSAWELAGGAKNTFKHFQLRLDLQNSDTTTTQAKLSEFNYYVQLTKRSFYATVTMDSNPKTVDLTIAEFTVTPQITGIVPRNVGYATSVEVTSVSTTSVTIKVYKISDGSTPTGFDVDIRADGA